MSKNNGPKPRKTPKKPKPASNPKSRAKRNPRKPDSLIGIYMTRSDAEQAARQKGISAELVMNGNRTYSLRKIG